MSKFKVLLTGGPDYITEELREQEVADLEESVKVRYGNGYEHFGFIGDTTVAANAASVVYTWTGRTKIAE